MHRKKKTIYVSSTYYDLKEHRSALKTELERAGFDVESMERYAAFAEPPLDKCLADVAACDGYVLLLAHRYGHKPKVGNPKRRSITELEYDKALDCVKPPFVFCVDHTHPWPAEHVDKGGAAQRLRSFRKRVEAAHGRREFSTPDNVTKQVLSALSSHKWPSDLHDPPSAKPARTAYTWPTPWDFSAYMADKREVFEGRDWLFKEIADWQANDHSRALLVRADFGVGKSAIMAELVHTNPGGRIAAWHFCQHDTQETLQPGAFVRSVAAQLAASLPGYKEVIDADPALQELLDRALTDPGSAFEGAILAPLAQLPAPPEPRLLLVDALDEALELDAANPRGAGTLVSLLAGKAGRFPPWLRVLATSRPNPQVQGPLQHAFGLKEIDAESAANQDDLRRYILGRCAREPLAGVLLKQGQATEALAERLVQRSLGKFLYAVRAMRDLEHGHIGVAELVALPPGMDSFYLDTFERRFARTGNDYTAARRVLGVLAVAREPLPPATIAAVLGISEAEVKAVHKALPDFLRLRAGKLTFDHFSMAEWLALDGSEGFARAGEYAVDTVAEQAAMRRWALAQVEQGVAHRSDYLLRHLPVHLGSDDERRRICGKLMLEHFEWLQARLDQAGVEALFADAQELEGLPGQELLLPVLRNSAHVLRRFPDQFAGQILGRAGAEISSNNGLAGLAASARNWLLDATHRPRPDSLLLPISRSLRLSNAHQVTLAGGCTCLAVMPDGRIAAGSEDGSVRLWDRARPTDVLIFEGHSGWVHTLAVLPDGRIASGCQDGTVCLWDPAHGVEPVILVGHSDRVLALAVLPDGRIVSGSADSTVRVWNPARSAEPQILKGHSAGVIRLAVLPDGRIVSGSSDHTIRIWDPVRPDASLVFRGHSGSVTALVVLPSGLIASGSWDHSLRMWDPMHEAEVLVFKGHSGGITALAALPDGRIASGCEDGTVRLWDPSRATESVVFDGHSGRVHTLAVLSDGRIVSGCEDGAVHLWHQAHPADSVVFNAHSRQVVALAILPDGLVASGSWDETVRLWDLTLGSESVSFVGHSGRVGALAILPDGHVASSSDDCTVRLWDPADLSKPMVLKGHSGWIHALAALPDGRIASGAWDNTVRLWDPAHSANVVVFQGHSGGVCKLAVLPDGRIASGSIDRTVRLWNPTHPEECLIFEGHSGWIDALTSLPDGRLVSACSHHLVHLWDPARPTEPMVFVGHSDRIHALAALPDGRIVSGSADHTVRLWDPRRRAEDAVFAGHSETVTRLAVLPDGRIVSGSLDCTVRLWDPTGRIEPLILQHPSGSITALAVLPNGRIASGSADNLVFLWDYTGKYPTRRFVADAAIVCLAATPTGLIVAGSADGGVHFLHEPGKG